MHFLQRHGTGNKAIQVYAADFLISPQGLRQSFQLILLFFQLFPLHFPLFFTDNPALFLTDRRPFPADGRIFPCIFIHVFVYFFACLTKILKERPLGNQHHAEDHEDYHQHISSCHAESRADEGTEHAASQAAAAPVYCTDFIEIQEIPVCLIGI